MAAGNIAFSGEITLIYSFIHLFMYLSTHPTKTKVEIGNSNMDFI
jgi:hypothetical protein